MLYLTIIDKSGEIKEKYQGSEIDIECKDKLKTNINYKKHFKSKILYEMLFYIFKIEHDKIIYLFDRDMFYCGLF